MSDEVKKQLDLFLVPDAPGHLKELFENDAEFHTIVTQLEKLMDTYGRTTIHDALWLADLMNKRRYEGYVP